MNIKELNLSVRSYNLLRRKGITEVETLLKMTDDEIIGLYNGRKATGEIREIIKPLRKTAGSAQMKIEIESRESITARAKEPFPACTALISITDKDADFAALENQPDYLLQMKFDDVSNEIFEEILGRQPTEAEALTLAEKFHMFNDEQAKEIVGFLNSILGRVELLICQCEYGESRSAGIAAAIRQYMYKDGIEIFADERYYPNKLVYRKILGEMGANNE